MRSTLFLFLHGAPAALRNPTVAHPAVPGWIVIETVMNEKVVREIIPRLKTLGAEGIIEYPLNKVAH